MSDDDAIRVVEELIDRFERAIELGRQSLLRTDEAQALIKEMRERVPPALPIDGMAYRTFEQRTSGKGGTTWFTTRLGSRYMDPQNIANLTKCLETIRAVADQFGPEALRQASAEKHQYQVGAGDYGRARRLIFDLMSRAKSDLRIVDPYADETIFPFVESLDPSVAVQVLAGSRPKAVLKTIAGGYQASGRKLDMRKTAGIPRSIFDRRRSGSVERRRIHQSRRQVRVHNLAGIGRSGAEQDHCRFCDSMGRRDAALSRY
jgi:hypothetical protein